MATATTAALLDVRSWLALDIDDEGRVLVGSDDSGSLQLVEITPDGERNPLTALPSRCLGRYVPGRRQVIVSHDQGGDENTQLSLLDLDAPGPRPATLAELIPIVHDPAHLHTLLEVSAETLIYATNRRNGTDMDVVARDLLLGDEQVVAEGVGYAVDTAVSPDRDRCAVTVLSLRPASTVVSVVGPGGERTDLTGRDELAKHLDASWTADGTALVMSSNRGREMSAVVRVRLDDGVWETLVEDERHNLSVLPSPDGTRLLVGTNDDGAHRLAIHDADGGWRSAIDLPEPSVVLWPCARWSPDGRQVLVSTSGPADPGSVRVVDARTGVVRTVVDAAADVPEALRTRMATPSSHLVPTPDGEQIPCFVYRPSATDVDRPTHGSAVVEIHGGPEAQAMRGWDPLIQSMVLSGITVLQPNVRGSDGYGKRWVGLDDVTLRLDAVADLAALHAWLPELGLDQHRAALTGGSYGGYMVLAGLTMQPDLWAAGVDEVGMSSLVSFLENTSDYRRAYREKEYGRLDRDRDFLRRASPLTYLDQLSAPVFIIHGANDPRVPLSEAEQIRDALQVKGIETVMKVYDDEGHGLAKRANRLDALPEAVAFLVDRLGPGA